MLWSRHNQKILEKNIKNIGEDGMKLKKMLMSCITIGLLGILGIPLSQAVMIEFSPQNQTANLSDSVSVDVLITGLEDGSLNEIVSSFDLDITYDPAIVSFAGVTFGTGLGLSFQSNTNSLGLIDIAEVSLEADATLQANQGNDLFLGTLSFDAIGFGVSPLNFNFDAFNLLTGLNGNILQLTSSSGSIVVGQVPLPSTLSLMGLGAFLFSRRKFFHK